MTEIIEIDIRVRTRILARTGFENASCRMTKERIIDAGREAERLFLLDVDDENQARDGDDLDDLDDDDNNNHPDHENGPNRDSGPNRGSSPGSGNIPRRGYGPNLNRDSNTNKRCPCAVQNYNSSNPAYHPYFPDPVNLAHLLSLQNRVDLEKLLTIPNDLIWDSSRHNTEILHNDEA